MCSPFFHIELTPQFPSRNQPRVNRQRDQRQQQQPPRHAAILPLQRRRIRPIAPTPGRGARQIGLFAPQRVRGE